MEQDKTELMLWEIYNTAKDLNDSDLQKALAIINLIKLLYPMDCLMVMVEL